MVFCRHTLTPEKETDSWQGATIPGETSYSLLGTARTLRRERHLNDSLRMQFLELQKLIRSTQPFRSKPCGSAFQNAADLDGVPNVSKTKGTYAKSARGDGIEEALVRQSFEGESHRRARRVEARSKA